MWNVIEWEKQVFCHARLFQIYRAIVQSVDPTNQMAMVLFPDYGNQEGVSFMDMHPLPKQTWVRISRVQDSNS